MEGTAIQGAVEPTIWFVAFHPKTPTMRFGRLARGRWGHVSAFAYVAGFKIWIFYDAQWTGLRLTVGSEEVARATLRAYVDAGCDVLKAERTERAIPLRARLGFYCVPCIAHLLGLPSVALSPHGLYHAILRNGGVSVDKRPASPDRPESGDRTANRDDQPRELAVD